MRRWSQPAKSAWFKDDFAGDQLAVGTDRPNHQTQQARNIGRCRLETSPRLKIVAIGKAWLLAIGFFGLAGVGLARGD
jgi:hypothetical protein